MYAADTREGLSAAARGRMRLMRAETVIATHTNADFDAFASLLAVRRLYEGEGAVAALPGSLARNVREFYRLHADEPVARDPNVEKVVFDHHGDELPDWVAPEKAVLSDDAALTTTLVGILAEREIAVTPLEATVFALGIHEDTGSLTYAGTTRRDADALAWCLHHGARQEEVSRYLHTTLAPEERELLATLLDSLSTEEVAGTEVVVAGATAEPADVSVSTLAHKLVDLTEARALVCLVEMGGRVFCVVRSQAPEVDAGALAEALGGGGHPGAAAATFKGSLDEALERLRDALPRAVREPGRARHGRVPAVRPERDPRPRGRAARGRRDARGPRQGDRPRPRPCAGEGDHELAPGELRRGDAAPRAPAPPGRVDRRPDRRRPRRARRRRGHAERRPPRP